MALPALLMPGVPFWQVPTVVFAAKTGPLIVAEPLRLRFPLTPTMPWLSCLVWL